MVSHDMAAQAAPMSIGAVTTPCNESTLNSTYIERHSKMDCGY